MTAPISTPYLLFLADAPDLLRAKTAAGIAHWRPELAVGEHSYPEALATTGLPKMTLTEGRDAGAKTLVVGVANAGGTLDQRWIATLREALEVGYDIASGMHERLGDVAALRATADRLGRALHDVRHPKGPIRVGSGERRPGRRLLTIGTDCSVGKMYASLALERELYERGIAATFRATGQTGILIAGSGIAVDAVVSDFISGAVEQLAPANAPDHWDLIEGQGSLFHPSFAGVSLGLLHGAQPDAMVLCHEPGRLTMRGLRDRPLPDLTDCIAMNEDCARLTNPAARVVGVALNTRHLDDAGAERELRDTADHVGLPCVDPVRTGVAPLADGLP